MNYSFFAFIVIGLFLIYVLYGVIRVRRKRQKRMEKDVEYVFREFVKTLNELTQSTGVPERKYNFDFLVRSSRDLKRRNGTKVSTRIQQVPKLQELVQSYDGLREHIQDCFRSLVYLAQRPAIVDHKRKLVGQVHTVWLSVVFDTRPDERCIIWVCTSKDTTKESIFADALTARLNKQKEWTAIRSFYEGQPNPIDDFKVEFL